MAKDSPFIVYVDDFSEGLRTDVPAWKAPAGSLTLANNIRVIPKGGFYMRKGNPTVDAWTPATSKPVKLIRKCVEHGCLFVQSGTKLFQTISESSPLHDIGVVLTDGYGGDLYEYNSAMKFTNGQDTYLTIAVGKVSAQFTDASTSIILNFGLTDVFRTPKYATVTADATTDKLAWSSHGLAVGDRVAFYNTGGALPTGISQWIEYFVINPNANDFQISTSYNGAALDITANGSGTTTCTTGIVYCKGKMITYNTKASAAFTVDAATDRCTSAAHGLVDGDRVTVSSATTLPAGLTAGTTYIVMNSTVNTFQLFTTAFVLVDITDAGTGTHTFNGGAQLGACKIQTGTYEADSVVTQVTSLNAPKGTCLGSIAEKMIVAGVPNTPHIEYYSQTANFATPNLIDAFSGSGSGREMFGKYGKITAIKPLLTKLYIAKRKGLEAWTGLDASALPTRQPFTDAYGVVNKNCMVQFGDRLALFTDTRRLKTIEPASTTYDPYPVINPNFDLKILNTLRNLDPFSVQEHVACQGYSERDNLLRTTVSQGAIHQTIVYHADSGAFSIDTGTAPGCWEEWNGEIYYGDYFTDKIYKAESGLQDGGFNPKMEVLTPIHQVGTWWSRQKLKKLLVKGLIKPGTTEFKITIYVDGAAFRTVVLRYDATYVNQTFVRTFGRASEGRYPVGHSEGAEADFGYEFIAPIDILTEAMNCQIGFDLQQEGGRVEVDAYGLLKEDIQLSVDTI